MNVTHPIIAKPLTMVPTEAVSSPNATGFDSKIIVTHITGEDCLKPAGNSVVSVVSAQAKIDPFIFTTGAPFINGESEPLILMVSRRES